MIKRPAGMKSLPFLCLSLFAAIAWTTPALRAEPAALFSEDFENGVEGSDVDGQATSQGGAEWSADYVSAILKYQMNTTPGLPELGTLYGQFWANPKGRGQVVLSTDLSTIPVYQVNIGYLSLNGVGSFVVNPHGTSASDRFCYWFTRGIFDGKTRIQIAWKDEAGELIPIGYLPAKAAGQGLAATGLSIRVTDEAQQLCIEGTPFDSEARPVQSSAQSNSKVQVRLLAVASNGSPVDIRVDNISVAADSPSR